MLRRFAIFATAIAVCVLGTPIAPSTADVRCHEEWTRNTDGFIEPTVICTDDGSTPGSSSGGDPDGCWTWGGKQVECTLQNDTGYYWWSSQRQTYCRLAIPPPEPSHEIWDGHRDA